MKRKIVGIFVCTLLIGTTGIAIADWEDGEGHIMHHPQLPDPYGLDVDFHDWWLGDDWYSGDINHDVTDIHFWYSWKGDVVKDIPWIYVSIWSNNIGPPSTPLEKLWEREFFEDEFIIAGPWDGDQGWYHPPDPHIPEDHDHYYQINIIDIPDPFEQHAGEYYWLVIQMPYYSIPGVGWKTSLDHYADNAVYGSPTAGWEPLWDPRNPGEAIDFAFVITGEDEGPDLRVVPPSLSWVGVVPEETLTGLCYVENIGDLGSDLDWMVSEWPSWGMWTFAPSSGNDLKPEDGQVPVQITLTAPNEHNQQYSGYIKIINLEDSSDFEIISISLTTPRGKLLPNTLFLKFLWNHPHLFPILRHILGF